MLNKASAYLIAALILTSLFSFQVINAAYTPDLSIIRISPYNYDGFNINFPKYQQGYYVEIANYGSGASPETNMDFYIKTFDNKTLKKTIKVPAMNAGSKRGVKFSLCNNTDGSFKEGYAYINPSKSFHEINYKNNIRKITLKDVLGNSTTVTEYYGQKIKVPADEYNYFRDLTYNSPLSSEKGIYQIECYIYNPPDYWYHVKKIRAKIPSYLRENVTFQVEDYLATPESIDNETMQLELENPMDEVDDVYIYINGTNLEEKDALKEPIQIIDTNDQNLAPGYYREIHERYHSFTEQFQDLETTYSYKIGSDYHVHHENVTKLVVKGDSKGNYIAGWFITPSGNFSSLKAFYGGTNLNPVLIRDGRFGISQKIRGNFLVGYEISGNNLQGFKNFRSLGFSSWTWKEIYN